MARSGHLCDRSFEFRLDDGENSDGRNLEGYAATFDDPTEIDSWEGNFVERISPGAFAKTLKENPTPMMQYDHGRDIRVGSTPIGAYRSLAEDDKGLAVRGRLFDNPVVEPVRQAIAAGAIKGMSFKFRVLRDEWTDKDGNAIPARDVEQYLWRPGDKGPLQRNIKEVQLFEAGPVANPAYASTSVGVRSAQDHESDREALMREYASTMSNRADAEPDADDVDYADPGYQADKKKRYPLDTAEHAKAAWDYINVAKNADKYSAGDLTKVKAAIKAACSKFGVDISESKSADDAPQTADTSSTLPDESNAPASTTASATEDAARTGTSSGSTKRTIPALRRSVPELPASRPTR